MWNLHPVSSRIFWWQQRLIGPTTSADINHISFERLVGIHIQGDVSWHAHANAVDLRFLEIGVDPPLAVVN